MKDLNYYCNEYYTNLKLYHEITDKNKKENILKDLNLLEYLITDRLETYKRLAIKNLTYIKPELKPELKPEDKGSINND